MSHSLSRSRPSGSVVIAGAGPAACMLALQLRSRGIAVLMVAPLSRLLPRGVEAIAERGIHLLVEAGMRGALERAGADVARGFHSRWDERAARRDDGLYAYVERSALAAEMRREAVRWGAELRDVERLGAAVIRGRKVSVSADDDTLTADAAADASGRSAVWFRPSVRRGRTVATLFEGPGRERARGGRVARLPSGWAYCLTNSRATTVGVIGAALLDATLPGSVSKALGLPPRPVLGRSGRRPAFVQWAEDPVRSRVLAVGDAALAYDPISGQGLAFAAASSLAAGAVLQSWLDEPRRTRLAAGYYRELIGDARRRHMHHVAALHESAPEEPRLYDGHSATEHALVRFTGPARRVGLRRAGKIVEDVAFQLADGGTARWVGSFDLQVLRRTARSPVAIAELKRRLTEQRLTTLEAERLIDWSMRKGLLTRADMDPAAGLIAP